MTFAPQRIDARNTSSIHTDGKVPLSAIAGAWTPLAIWYEATGEAPDAERLKQALESFPWRHAPSDAPHGAVMLSTPMVGVFLEVIPEDESFLNRLGFSISGTLHAAHLDELAAVAEAKWPGHGDRSRRAWSADAAVRNSALAEAEALKGIPPLPVPFETVVSDGIEDALRATIRILADAYEAVPAEIVESGLDDAEKAARRNTIRAIYFPDAVEESRGPAP